MGRRNRDVLMFKRLHPEGIIPSYQTDGASGFDFHAIEDVHIPAGETRLVSTGLACQVPQGTELQIRPRSGMSIQYPAYVSNAPGTVDEDYRGELKIIITALIKAIFIKKGDRIAQGVIAPVIRPYVIEVRELDNTERGEGGFGSTGQ